MNTIPGETPLELIWRRHARPLSAGIAFVELMAEDTDDGLAYLQALRQSAPTAPAAFPPHEPNAEEPSRAVPPPIPGSPLNFPGPEKRRSPRYKCEASVEISREGHPSRTWATCTDVSMHGCYVEATDTYPVGTELQLKLQVNEFQMQGRGCVRVTYPSLGMGIAFTNLSEENRARLRELLRNISRPSVILGVATATPVPAVVPTFSIPLPDDSAAALRALATFFESRQLLMRDEFLRILRKSQADSQPPDRQPKHL